MIVWELKPWSIIALMHGQYKATWNRKNDPVNFSFCVRFLRVRADLGEPQDFGYQQHDEYGEQQVEGITVGRNRYRFVMGPGET
jgi:hypothetical protein